MRGFAFVAILLGAAAALGNPGRLIPHEGRLLRADGTPAAGNLVLVFRLYESPTGGVHVWMERLPVTLSAGGYYTALLGAVEPLPVFDGRAYWLTVQVEGEAEMLPRTRLASAPYALWSALADDARKLGGDPSSAILRTTSPLDAGNLATGTVPGARLAGVSVPGSFAVQGALSLGGTVSGLRPENAAGAPYTCGSGTRGGVYYDTVAGALFACTALGWRALSAVVAGCGATRDAPGESCLAIRQRCPSVGSGRRWLQNSRGEPFEAYCDMTTDSGGWTLILAYAHPGGANAPLVTGTIPLDPNSGYSHMDTAQIRALAPFKEVRFYCQTSAHARRIHFKTSQLAAVGYVRGEWHTNAAGYWTTNFEPLVGHSANLPASADSAATHYSDDIRLTEHTFYRWVSQHWNIRYAGDRWECDDYPGNASYTTLHNIFVR